MPSIALLDNTCNTAYITAKLLRRNGHEVDFVEQSDAHYNHQPVWEDVDLALPAAEVDDRPRGTRYWRDVEARVGWVAPAWVRRPQWEPLDLLSAARLPVRLKEVMPVSLTPFGTAAMISSLPIIRVLREYDFLFVLGPSASLGYLSGRPYAVITMGWEISTLPFLTSSRNPIHRARAWLHRAALGSATRILGMPSTDLPFLRRLQLERLLQPFPVPVDLESYEKIPTETRAAVLGDDLAQRTAGKVIYFHPSRVYLPLKGTDTLLRAFRQVLDAGVPGFLILVGWGDVKLAKDLVQQLNLQSSVHILPDLLSKKRLIRTFNVIDVAVVQLVPPGYSTLDREALACAKPVISSYDPRAPQPHPADDPAPIVEARTVEQARDAMIRLADPEVRARLGHEGREWVRRNHEAAALRALMEVVDRVAA